MKILVLNAGSSSQKSRLYDLPDTLPATAPEPLWEANADWTKSNEAAELKITVHGQTIQKSVPAESRSAVLEETLKTLWSGETRLLSSPDEIAVVGHRVVHGGPYYRASVMVTDTVKTHIKELFSFAPLHNPVNLEGIETIERVLGQVPQVAVFDTAFHATLPQETAIYPGPYEWFAEGIRRYGFHGTSHAYCSQRITELLPEHSSPLRIINCHLGNGCSLAAIRDGQSIETTMGFTPLEGLMMGSRSGTIDPSILIYLQREKGYTADRLDQLLNKESGLKGISGISNDLRRISQAAQEGNQRAQLAIDMFIYRLRFFIGALLPALGGIDVLSFTGGIGENAAAIRASTCAAFQFLRLQIDDHKNASSKIDSDIATDNSAVRVFIIHTEEDWEIAKEAWQILHS